MFAEKQNSYLHEIDTTYNGTHNKLKFPKTILGTLKYHTELRKCKIIHSQEFGARRFDPFTKHRVPDVPKNGTAQEECVRPSSTHSSSFFLRNPEMEEDL